MKRPKKFNRRKMQKWWNEVAKTHGSQLGKLQQLLNPNLPLSHR